MIEAIRDWLQNGADIAGGMQLITRAGIPPVALAMLKANPKAFRRIIICYLVWRYKIDRSLIPSKVSADYMQRQQEKAFRNEFPFLNDINCPMELQALATRKITLFHQYVELHGKLTACSSLKQCADIARKVVVSFMENRDIWNELNYYKEHGAILGKHPLFRSWKRREALRHQSVKYLMKRKRQLENNIWRVNDELKKGDKPHLAAQRMARLRAYQEELAEVNRLLEDE